MKRLERKRSVPDFTAAVEEFLTHCQTKGLSLRSIEWYKQKLEGFGRFVEDTPLDEITPSLMRQFIKQGQEKGGLRVSEAANLKPQDVILERGMVFLHVRHGKGGKERMAPVTDATVAKELLELAAAREGRPNLFGVTAGTLKVHAHNVKKATGVDFHAHRMRQPWPPGSWPRVRPLMWCKRCWATPIFPPPEGMPKPCRRPFFEWLQGLGKVKDGEEEEK